MLRVKSRFSVQRLFVLLVKPTLVRPESAAEPNRVKIRFVRVAELGATCSERLERAQFTEFLPCG